MAKQERIAIIGLGYVGLPVALAFAEKFPGTVGFDINVEKVAGLKKKIDPTGSVTTEELARSTIKFTTQIEDLKGATFFVVAVPTPIDENRKPDLSPVVGATRTVAKALTPGAVVVYESTVYPGVTDEICAPLLEELSGLKRGRDFTLGYSPERINPGDQQHTLQTIVKVVSGENAATLERVANTYSAIVTAGVYRASSIRVAEAAKVIENTQRDLNIALMNELSIIFDRLDIPTREVLAAAKTKWNFLPFTPGLVGGHCIGVDPYYLTTKAEAVGYHPQVILAGRRINDDMGRFIAQKLIKLLIHNDKPIKNARVGILGLTFKENVPDLRNSRVPDIIAELRQFGIEPVIDDAMADPAEAVHEYGLELSKFTTWSNLDGLILAVPHAQYLAIPAAELLKPLRSGGVLIDIKAALDTAKRPAGLTYWAL